MAPRVKIGAMIIRGAAKESAETMRVLVENEGRVAEIVAEIDARSDVFREMQRAAQVASDALDAERIKLAEREVPLVEGLAKLATDITAADEKHASDMAALGRRTKEVTEREQRADDRDTAQDARSTEIERTALNRENELREREETVEARETTADARDEKQQSQASDLDTRTKRIMTAASQVKQAVANVH